MRRINSEFRTANMSEEGQKLSNRDYFGYVEMDDFACYVLADGLDEEPFISSARLVVESVIREFTEHPSLSGRKLKCYLIKAHKELLRQRGGMHLKASVVVAATDYRKIRYCHVGNSRFYLIRNARILARSTDQSLTQNLVEREKILPDQAAAHEARNNLYSFLGERGTPQVRRSKKIKLESGDTFAVLSRGVWERCDDGQLLDFLKDAKEPQEILNQVEDVILKNQENQSIDNYTLAVTFVDGVYQSPKKKWTIKKIFKILLPILLIVGAAGLGLYLRGRSVRMKRENLQQYMESGEAYLLYDNYQKAAEEFTEALKLAKTLNDEEEVQEADQYKKLAEQIIMADAAIMEAEYQKAQTMYLTARELSIVAGNTGKRYIDSQLELTKNYIDVFDLLDMGERKEADGNLEGAIEKYKEAKEKAASLYYAEGQEEAMQKQAAAEAVIEAELQKETDRKKELEESAEAEAAKQQQEEEAKRELENQQKANDQQNAIELENKGNEMLAGGMYESAITFYQTAQAIYIRLELPDLADGINGKIAAARAGIEAARQMEQQQDSEAWPEETKDSPDEAKDESGGRT